MKATGFAINCIQPVVSVREDVESPPLDRMVQVVPRGLVVGLTQRFAALNRVLELLLTGRKIDDVDLGVYRGVGT